MRYALLIASFIAFVTGCESDVKKLQRLELDKIEACLVAQADQRALDSVQKASDPSTRLTDRMNAMTDSLNGIAEECRRLGYSDAPNARDSVMRLRAIADRLREESKRTMRQLDSIVKVGQPDTLTPQMDSLIKKHSASQAKCELATRKYDAVGR